MGVENSMLKTAVVFLILLLYEIPQISGSWSLGMNEPFHNKNDVELRKRSDFNVAEICLENFQLCEVIDAIVKARTPPENIQKEKIKEIVKEEIGPLIRKRRNPEDDLIRLLASTPHPGGSAIRKYQQALF